MFGPQRVDLDTYWLRNQHTHTHTLACVSSPVLLEGSCLFQLIRRNETRRGRIQTLASWEFHLWLDSKIRSVHDDSNMRKFRQTARPWLAQNLAMLQLFRLQGSSCYKPCGQKIYSWQKMSLRLGIKHESFGMFSTQYSSILLRGCGAVSQKQQTCIVVHIPRFCRVPGYHWPVPVLPWAWCWLRRGAVGNCADVCLRFWRVGE